MKRMVLSLLLAVVLLLGGCSQPAPAETVETTVPPVTVGLCLPGRGVDWKAQADAIIAALEAKDIVVHLEYGTEDVLLQQSQVQSLLYKPVDCLILGAYDPLTLCATLQETTVPVLAYDRMLRFSQGIDGFVGADYFGAGQQIATAALARYDLDRPLTAELLMGQPQDPNALAFYEGIMSVLQPLLDDGSLKVLSGRTRFEEVCTGRNGLEEARDLCYDYLSMEYENTFPDILICGSDALAEGCIQALEGMAFSPEESWPVVTGLGHTEDGQYLLENGTLTLTAAIDTEDMVATCVSWVLALLEGAPLPENTPVFNGVIDVPADLQALQLISSD